MFDFLTKKFSSIFSGLSGKNLNESNISEVLQRVKEALIEADVPYRLVNNFIDEVKTDALGKKITKSLKADQQFIKIVHDKLSEFMGGQSNISLSSFQIPSVIMVMGLQGSGKTTTIAKFANLILEAARKRDKERNILLASVDFYRPAAIEQLEILSKQIGAKFYRSNYTNPIKAAQDIHDQFKKGQYDYLILDTAGRLHIDNDMMQELKEINLKLMPKYKIMVLDSMTGQESLKIAKTFDEQIGFTFGILTKMDSQTRGGAALAFRYELKKPIAFIGTGEKIADLEQFYPDRMATRILGMGDIVSLAEKIESEIKLEDQKKLDKSFNSTNFTLQDFADQMDMMSKLGPISKLAQYLPGMGSLQISPEKLSEGEREMKKMRAIICSMTSKERFYPRVLDSSRKQRIAKGSGLQVSDVNFMLEKFEQSKQFAKLLKKGGLKNVFK